ncbi:hypothetical protein JQ544_04835 [Bradyrhizobium diazoefficiens]|nr:hypothetical protein [Bradyrhizobium diazoefficiens]MBR0810835.1 hypothetical protein [Bradyrhizobium diazoefficiens]
MGNYQARSDSDRRNGSSRPELGSRIGKSRAEWKFRSGISVMAKLDGEFAERSLTYAGSARLRYAW